MSGPRISLQPPLFTAARLPGEREGLERESLRLPPLIPVVMPVGGEGEKSLPPAPTFTATPLSSEPAPYSAGVLSAVEFESLKLPIAHLPEKVAAPGCEFPAFALPERLDVEKGGLELPPLDPSPLPNPVPLLKQPIDRVDFISNALPEERESLRRVGLQKGGELEPFRMPEMLELWEIKAHLKKRSLKKPLFRSTQNPVMRNFEQLLRKKSYQDIFAYALKFGTPGDIRMLKRHSLLHPKYSMGVFKQLIQQLPSLLPRSGAFKRWLENDQIQIDQLAAFCKNLLKVDRLETMGLEQTPLISRIRKTYNEKEYEKGVLAVKNGVYCFGCEILAQEEVNNQKYGVEVKELQQLRESLELLSMHIQETSDSLRMKAVRHAAHLSFEKWEDREVLPSIATPPATSPQRAGVPSLIDLLKAIGVEKPQTNDVNDYINEVLRLPEMDKKQRVIKAGYHLEFAKVCHRLTTETGLKQSLFWTDLAILLIRDHVGHHHPLLLKCYEHRGATRAKIATWAKKQSKNERVFSRRRVDETYRDFHRSLPLTPGEEVNFVRQVELAKGTKNLELATKSLETVVQVDEDYAESRYVEFIKRFEKLNLNEGRVLHSHFAFLNDVPKDQLFDKFLEFLQGKVQRDGVTFFKIRTPTSSAFLEVGPDSISMDGVGADFLLKMFTRGLKNVSLPTPDEKVYVVNVMTREKFCTMVDGLRKKEHRFEEIEAALRAFHKFEMAAFYKSSLKHDPEPLTAQTIFERLSPELLMQVAQLHLLAMKTAPQPAVALLHACHVLALYDRIPGNWERKKLDVLIKRSHIYAEMGFKNSQISALEESIAFGKKLDSRYLNPALHHALGLAYEQTNRIEEAKEQWRLSGSLGTPHLLEVQKQEEIEAKVRKLCTAESDAADREVQAEFLRRLSEHCESGKIHFWEEAVFRASKAKTFKELLSLIPQSNWNPKWSSPEIFKEMKSAAIEVLYGHLEVAAIARFQDENIEKEALEVIYDHHDANSEPSKHRAVPIWEDFIDRIERTTSSRAFSEGLFSSVLPSEKVTNQSLLRIARIGNLKLSPIVLDQIKGYVPDALDAYDAAEARLEDEIASAQEEANALEKRTEAFYEFKDKLSKLLLDGEKIRIGSSSREKLSLFYGELQKGSSTADQIIQFLEEVSGNPLDGLIKDSVERELEDAVKEISEILKLALDVTPPTIKYTDHVLTVSGINIFLSQVKEAIQAEMGKNPQTRDVHILGIHLYIDTQLTFPGINWAVGGEYVQFLMDQGVDGKQVATKLTIDLSGNDGEDGPPPVGEARSGANPCDSGERGASGIGGKGGGPGGDFCIRSTAPIVGFSPEIIEIVTLSGGVGGAGSDGKAGGNGAAGVKGADGREGVRSGDLADSNCGYIDDGGDRKGQKSRTSGSGGRGGDAGTGGAGGKPGRLLIDPIPEDLVVEKEGGGVGEDGTPGEGGLAGESFSDGFDIAYVKGGGWIFAGRTDLKGIGLHVITRKKDREKAGWADTYTPDQSRSINKGREKESGNQADHANRNEQTKHNLKEEMFKANLEQHIHAESPGNKAYAFAAVTDRKAIARETAAALREQLSLKQQKRKDLENLRQTAAKLLKQTQAEEVVQTKHARVANFSKVENTFNRRAEIESFFNSKVKDERNKLPFNECAPNGRPLKGAEFHEIENAMYEVNTTFGQNMQAVGRLVLAIARFPNDGGDRSKYDNLVTRLKTIIQEMSKDQAMIGIDLAVEASKSFSENHPLRLAIEQKSADVKAFESLVKEQQKEVQAAYQKEIDRLKIERGILKFLYRDRLVYTFMTHHFDEAKKRWIEERLYHKSVAHAIEVHGPDNAEKYIDSYFRRACAKLEELRVQVFEGKEFKPAFKDELKRVSGELSLLQRGRSWVIQRLPQLVDKGILPSQWSSKIDTLYLECSRAWSNLSPSESEGEVPASESEAEVLESTPSREVDPLYLEELRALSPEPAGEEGISLIFLSLTYYCKDFQVAKALLAKLRTGNSKELGALRNTYWESLADPQQLQDVSAFLEPYIAARRIYLIKQECENLLVKLAPQGDRDLLKQIEPFLVNFFTKAASLYQSEAVLRGVDFLEKAKEVIVENSGPIWLGLRGTQLEEIDLEKDLLEKITQIKWKENRDVIDSLRSVLGNVKNERKVDAHLFLLINLDLSFTDTAEVIELLRQKENPRFETALSFLSQHLGNQTIAFENKWEIAIKKAQFYDKIRAQVKDEDPQSIEAVLYSIGEDGNALTPNERVALLDRVEGVLSGDVCFTALPLLRSIQNEVVKKIATFPNGVSEAADRYNTALREGFPENTPLLPQMVRTVLAENTFSKEFLKPVLVAIRHFPFEAKDLLDVYTRIEKLNLENTDPFAIVKKLLLKDLRGRYQKLWKQQEEIHLEIGSEQMKLLVQLRDGFKVTQLLNPEHCVGRLFVWMKLLDSHFEGGGDPKGEKRKELYAAASKRVIRLFSGNIEEEVQKFGQWLLTSFNEEVFGEKKSDRALLEGFLKKLESADSRESAICEIEKRYWRGVVPYAAKENSLVQMVEGKNFGQDKDQILKLLKRKFDDAMAFEEGDQIETGLDKNREEHQKALDLWITELEKRIEKETLSAKDLESIYPIGETFFYKIPPTEEERVERELPAGEDALQTLGVYLKHLSAQLKSELSLSEDFGRAALLLKIWSKRLDSMTETSQTVSLRARIRAMQDKLIIFEDAKDSLKKEGTRHFIQALAAVHGYQSEQNPLAGDLKQQQLKLEFKGLESSLSSCCALIGLPAYLSLIRKFTQFLEEGKVPLSFEMLHQVFWALPRIKDPAVFDVIRKNEPPEQWAVKLLEIHCFEVVTPSITSILTEFPDLALGGLSLSEKEKRVAHVIKERQEMANQSLKDFQESLSQLIAHPQLKMRHKESFLRAIAGKLSLLNQGKLGFPVENFTHLIKNYLGDSATLKILSRELLNPLSVIGKGLFEPSFELFKLSLLRAWMEGNLDLSKLQPLEKARLLDHLCEIETVKKEEAMRSLVEALGHQKITPILVEAVTYFAEGSWELDPETLKILAERTEANDWYSRIEKYSKDKRSKERNLETLIDLMVSEMGGINSSIAELLKEEKGKIPLLQDIQDIQDFYKNGEHPICDWTREEVKAWADKWRGEYFGSTAEQLKQAIAVVSRASKLSGFHPLRDTQILAIWLKLRPREGSAKGRIGLMFTGQGKTVTFGALAVLRALANSAVDILTTSFVHAQEGETSQKPLFDIFGLTVSNNCDQECEAKEDQRSARYFKDGKPVDIVYGDIGAFERDLLLTEFHDTPIIHPERLKKIGTALFDEVDGLLLDNAGMVLYLSHNVDTLRFLERIFNQIWIVAHEPPFESALPIDDEAVRGIAQKIKQKIENKEIVLPQYKLENARYMEMQAIIDRKLLIWIRSALYAKTLREDNEYVVGDQVHGSKTKKAITALDKGTGVEQFSLKWSNGLHPFLQLKHGLELDSESLKAVFLSNYFFFKRYGEHAYGLSGTLGSATEQEYLKKLYNVELCKIPRFEGERYVQYKPTIVATKNEWVASVEASVDRQISENKRAVLVICETIEDVKLLQGTLKDKYPELQAYTSSLQEISFLAHENPTLMKPGDLIIATNLAGRGSDLKTNSLLEQHGGLHVVLSYLPSNIRIEQQAFGRTARSGNEGSGEFIIRDPELRQLSELYRIRDLGEKQRLETIAVREVKKIEFEHELLNGFTHNHQKVEGFAHTLAQIKAALVGEKSFYRDAQLASLKNRWAFWIDHMEEKIGLVHMIGKEAVIDSFKKFQEGVLRDFNAGGLRLIKEPIELIKLGGEYRRVSSWSKAAECYALAAQDPHYEYIRYYEAACKFIQEPTSSFEARKRFKAEAKKATEAIKTEVSQLQTALQAIPPLVEQSRVKMGSADYGNPYKARTEEKTQIWSIFLSGIEAAIGGTLTAESLKTDKHGQNPEKILAALGDHYKGMRLSTKFSVKEGKVFYDNQEIPIPKMLQAALPNFKSGGSVQNRLITKEEIKGFCSNVSTQASSQATLNQMGCQTIKTVYRLLAVPPSLENWPENAKTKVQFLLSSLVEELQCEGAPFDTHEAIEKALEAKKGKYPDLQKTNFKEFVKFLNTNKLIIEDKEINLKAFGVPVEIAPTLDEIQITFNERFNQLMAGREALESLREPLFKACVGKREMEEGSCLFFRPSIYLSELQLPATQESVVDILWALLDQAGAIKPPKIRVIHEGFEKQLKEIEGKLKEYFSNEKGLKDDELEDAIEGISEIINSSVGMIHKLEDKKATAEFAAIIRKYYHDHGKHAPDGLGFFIELGLEVIADLIEKKDPPAWYEVTAIIALGVLQIVAGAVIKAYLPVVGELLGNALASSGMDDIMFAITSAATGQFSWSDYGAAKLDSLKRSITSSAISCGLSFAGSAISEGSVGKAWEIQKTAIADRALPGAFNLGSYVVKEVGRNFISTGISQVALRGLDGLAQVIASSYDEEMNKEIGRVVESHWEGVKTQAEALYKKKGGEASVKGQVESCIKASIKRVTKSNFFDSVVRGSKQVIPQASSLIPSKGWAGLVSHAPSIANLGVSVAKLGTLVRDSVQELARQVRETKEREEESAKARETEVSAEFSAYLTKAKEEYASKIKTAFKGVLNNAVYSPLVSLGAQGLAQLGRDTLMPLSKQEQFAMSGRNVLAMKEVKGNVEEAFFDELLRRWADAGTEVDPSQLSEDELKQIPENGTESLEVLHNQYQGTLKVYKDADNHLYVQRPTREEYAQGIADGIVSGDPAIVAVAAMMQTKIAFKTPDGKIKTYFPNGKITTSSLNDVSSDTMILDFKPDAGGEGVGHVSWGKGKSAPTDPSGNNCLYDAIEAATGGRVNGAELRQQTAEKLSSDPELKRFYHEWSLSGEPTTFVGKDSSTLANTGWSLLGIGAAAGEATVAGGLLMGATLAGGPVLAAGLATAGMGCMLHAYSSMDASTRGLLAGHPVDSMVSQFLQATGVPRDVAENLDMSMGLMCGLALTKPGDIARMGQSIVSQARTIGEFSLRAGRAIFSDAKDIGNFLARTGEDFLRFGRVTVEKTLFNHHPPTFLELSDRMVIHELNTFNYNAHSLSEIGQQNIRTVRGWAKGREWEKMPRPEGTPEYWGERIGEKLEWRVKIKPEPAWREGVKSTFPRVEIRQATGGQGYVNPFTRQVGGQEIGSHIHLENPYQPYNFPK